MGRTTGKLIPFLKKYLNADKGFVNLKYEDEDKKIFFIVLPRFMKDKYEQHEYILKEWYNCNGKLNKYINYSKGKSVFQAALKKSIYLMKEKKVGKHLRYRFATEAEIAENRRKLKEKEHLRENPESPVSTHSSGYQSGSEDDKMHLDDLSDCLDDILDHPEKYISDYSFDDIFPDIKHETGTQEGTFNDLGQLLLPMPELPLTPVCADVTWKKYWLCTQMVKVKSIVQLICESQVIINEDSGIKEGSVVLPTDVFEPGITYDMKKSFELNDTLHIFFVPSVN